MLFPCHHNAARGPSETDKSHTETVTSREIQDADSYMRSSGQTSRLPSFPKPMTCRRKERRMRFPQRHDVAAVCYVNTMAPSPRPYIKEDNNTTRIPPCSDSSLARSQELLLLLHSVPNFSLELHTTLPATWLPARQTRTSSRAPSSLMFRTSRPLSPAAEPESA
jgi:hypothetical protein